LLTNKNARENRTLAHF